MAVTAILRKTGAFERQTRGSRHAAHIHDRRTTAVRIDMIFFSVRGAITEGVALSVSPSAFGAIRLLPQRLTKRRAEGTSA